MTQRHMDRLSSFDASFLANERDHGHMAIGAVLLFDGPAPSQEDFVAHVESRLHLLPRLRQRLALPPLGLGRPLWVDFPDFNIAAHVRRLALPPPGSEQQVRDLAGSVFTPALDRGKPLWELWLVEGVEAGFAVIYKTHHALADGISAVDIGTLLFDLDPDGRPEHAVPTWSPKAPPSRLSLLSEGVRGLGATGRRALRSLLHLLHRPGAAIKRASDGAAGIWEVAWALTKPAPKVPLNVNIGPERSMGWAQCSLSDLNRVKEALGGTLNDVSLAVATGALRRWLDDRAVEIDGLELKALVPVSVRGADEHAELGNMLTAMRGPLPVGLVDPARRLRVISAAMDALKASKQPLGAKAIWGLNDWFRDFAPPILLAATARVNFSTRLFNLLVTNFPGPQLPLYVLGRELRTVYPVGFLAPRHALAIAIMTYNGQVTFGLLADRASMPDADRLAGYINEAVTELLIRSDQAALPDLATEFG
jgi:WS/DGAT/MGAT family acyltransferase